MTRIAAKAISTCLLLLAAGITWFHDNGRAEAAEAEKPAAVTRTLEQEAFRRAGTVYLPLKETAAPLDLQVAWNPANSSVEVTGLHQAVSLKLGQPKAYTITNKTIKLGAPVLVQNGVTYVPDSLFAKAFSLPVTWDGGSDISLPYSEQYIKSVNGRRMFWLNREYGVIYTGESGRTPVRSGILEIGRSELDWVSIRSRLINSESSVLDIDNAYGEPHVHQTRYRALLHKGRLVRQGDSSFSGARGLAFKENVPAFQGHVVIVDRHLLTLVTPDGQAYKTYDLRQITGVDDAFAVEAVEPDFLLVRPYQQAALYVTDRKTLQAVLLYPQLLSAEDKVRLEEYPDTEVDYPGDGLTYTGRSGRQLSFEWKSFPDGRLVHFTYTLPLPGES